MSVVMATFTVSMMPRASVAAGRIQEVLDTPSSVVPPAIPVIPTAARSSVELRGVGFHYPGAEAPVLTDISFTTEAGRTTAVVGSTGAGTTTLDRKSVGEGKSVSVRIDLGGSRNIKK